MNLLVLPTWSRYTVSPSFRVSWNQSRHVTRLPVQLLRGNRNMTAQHDHSTREDILQLIPKRQDDML